jgi:putative Ca2+/H+ antiporter (TMEM165/GDT1 family)
VVTAAEIGDKTQLLSLLLAARYPHPWRIVAGIAVATLLNHWAAAWLGQTVSRLIGPELLQYLLAGSFVAMGLWLLVPDRLDDDEGERRCGGVFLTAATLFFLAEMGDKTQVATAALGARFDAVTAVVVGTTLGMLMANVPVVFGGRAVMRRLPVLWVQRSAAALFIALGVVTWFAPGLLSAN